MKKRLRMGSRPVVVRAPMASIAAAVWGKHLFWVGFGCMTPQCIPSYGVSMGKELWDEAMTY